MMSSATFSAAPTTPGKVKYLAVRPHIAKLIQLFGALHFYLLVFLSCWRRLYRKAVQGITYLPSVRQHRPDFTRRCHEEKAHAQMCQRSVILVFVT